ncbi:hypothetical protein BH23THE1_BH23THE1_36550 [soil metagenome]
MTYDGKILTNLINHVLDDSSSSSESKTVKVNVLADGA